MFLPLSLSPSLSLSFFLFYSYLYINIFLSLYLSVPCVHTSTIIHLSHLHFISYPLSAYLRSMSPAIPMPSWTEDLDYLLSLSISFHCVHSSASLSFSLFCSSLYHFIMIFLSITSAVHSYLYLYRSTFPFCS